MKDVTDDVRLAGAVEALLFVTDEPVGATALASILEVEPSRIEQILREMRERLSQENRGVQLREVAGGWRFCTHPEYHDLLERYVISWDTRKLSNAALETLSIIAYLQPVTRAGVASVRGVNSDSPISSLLEKGLVREAGTADAPGNPMMYATTRLFLERFGLRSTADLPDIADFAPDDEARAFIRERLSATRIDDEETVPHSLATASGASGAEATDSDEGQQGGDKTGSELLADALASSFGLVEKVDFDSLVFETDDE